MATLIFLTILGFGLAGLLYGRMQMRRRQTGELVVSTRKLLLIPLVFFVGGVLFNSVVVIPAGEIGVVQVLGAVRPYILREGLRTVNPIANVVRMSVRTQEVKEVASVPSQEGLLMHLETSLLFNLTPEQAPQVFRNYGLGYREVVVGPTLRSVIRGVTAEHDAKALYTAGRETVTVEIQRQLDKVFGPSFHASQVLLRDVKPPISVSEAIERKLRAEQEAQQMQFVLQRERQEAERKRIEAAGVRDFQAIVSQGITPSLLQWKAIEATEKLAASPNTKFILSGRGLPVLSTMIEK